MSGLLQRLGHPRHRLWLTAALLALLALGVAQAFPLRPPPPVRGPADTAPQLTREGLTALLAITADSHSLVAEADQARAANAALLPVVGGLQIARPFRIAGIGDPSGAERARQCLALAMYYEAGFEGQGGRMAVAQVVLNRVRHPAFPNTICSVVFQRSANNVCQFTFACDGALQRPRLPGLWNQTLIEAAAALGGSVYAPVGMATHYHADYVFPYWAPKLEKIATVGTHVFYRWPRGWGLRGAFNAVYDGAEPMLAALEMPLTDPAAADAAVPQEVSAAAGPVAPFRAENEGGFVDPSLGWVPAIARPAGSAAPEAPAPAAPPAPSP